ncbi:MAG: tripartite tricarboxylate transporter substrate binding protein [Hydrogenophaga sp.]|nr:tripartite tricarboxylate transporter substrate binding protein [Hydrogenophaga sp.]
MHTFRRRPLLVLSIALALASVAAPALAQGQPLRIVVPFAAGGAADTYARLLAQQWQEASVAPTVIVDNKPGAGGAVGSDLAAKATPDGNTLLMVTVGHAVNPFILPKLPYDSRNDFVPVGMVASVPSLLVVHPGFQGSSIKDLLSAARAKPGGLEYASSGTGSTSHVAAAQLESMAKVDMLHVPYRGAAPALQDVMGGRVAFTIDVITSSLPHVKSGKLKALAVTSAQRSPQAPDIPTIAESGVDGYEFTAWYVLLAPARTPADTVKRLNTALQQTLTQAAFVARLNESGAQPMAMDSAASAQYLDREFSKWSRIVKERNIKAE